MSLFKYTIVKQSKKSAARVGKLHTQHGIIHTPCFMPVGTAGTVKALTPTQLEATQSQIVLANTYHLSLRPGIDLIKKHGGLHSFMNWQRPILTDSGGYQVFSLANNCTIDDTGVTFRSHIDGHKKHFTPTSVIDSQLGLNSDIMMVLDICTPYGENKDQTARDMAITHQWAKCAKTHWLNQNTNNWCFAIVQGGFFNDLRLESAQTLAELDFPGYALGGLSVGEPMDELHHMITTTASFLPVHKPRYVMGIGLPENIKIAIENGIDMFDCVLPTRLARHGQFFYEDRRINIKLASFKDSLEPLDPNCTCYTCQHFSKSYLRHLFISKEMLAGTLLSIHNISYLNNVVTRVINEQFS